MFELSQLRCFVAVADQLHFGRAAEQLNMTQPPLSRQIQLLESAIGALLLHRTSRSVQLTPAGRIFLPEARRILRLSESAMRWTQRVWRGEAGTLRIGFTAASGYHYLPAVLGRLRDALPGVNAVLREMVSGQQTESLVSDDLDVGFVRPPISHAHLDTLPVLEEGFVLALPADEPLAQQATITLADLDQRPFVMYSPDAARYFHDLLVARFSEAGIAPHFVHQVGQIHSMLGLVDADFGVALVPEAAAGFHFPNVVFRPIELGRGGRVQLHAAWRRDNDNPVLRPFIEQCLAGGQGLASAQGSQDSN